MDDVFSTDVRVVVASTFYTAALERPLVNAFEASGKAVSLTGVPYNQLYSFLLDPYSVIPEKTPVKALMLVRVEDLIRMELVSGQHAADALLRAFRERTEQFIDVLSRISRLSVTLLMCPAGRGAYDVSSLGNAIRVAEQKIAAEFRRQQRHLVIGWAEFERAAKCENCFNAAGDRLGHVPFSPAGLEAVAGFLAAQSDRMPSTTLASRAASGGDGLDLQRFLASLQVEMSVSPFSDNDEQQALNLVRHTTHFINVPGRKFENGEMRRLADRGEAWTVRVRDRFGDYGISGVATFELEDRIMRAGLLFLTCPVLGRQVEYGFMAWIGQLAEARGAELLEIPFNAGRDNHGFKKLLEDVAGVSMQGAETIFRLPVPGLVDAITSKAPDPSLLSSMMAKTQLERVPLSA